MWSWSSNGREQSAWRGAVVAAALALASRPSAATHAIGPSPPESATAGAPHDDGAGWSEPGSAHPDTSTVPEPATIGLVAAGAVALAGARVLWRRAR